MPLHFILSCITNFQASLFPYLPSLEVVYTLESAMRGKGDGKLHEAIRIWMNSLDLAAGFVQVLFVITAARVASTGMAES